MKKIRGQTVYPLKERLARLSVENEATGCIEWVGTIHGGYGKLVTGSRTDGSRKTVYAHRLSYEVNTGEIPDGMLVCHKCDNRKCINPEHLFIGTFQDNINDREAKGRNKIPNLKHEQHPNSKLTWASVVEIRVSPLSNAELGRMFGVARRTISDARRGVTWSTDPKPSPPEVTDET